MPRGNKFRSKFNWFSSFSYPGTLVLLLGAGLCTNLHAQQRIALNDLSAFQNPGPGWRIAGDVKADLTKKDVLNYTDGTGILVNKPGKDIYTIAQHGDMDIELDYLMAQGANSGIYLQGRYEIQLLDSWGVLVPHPGDNGGIYERWEESRPEGRKGYDGFAPRQNVSRAPGLWQHMKISFQAPRFDANGQKTENARILKIVLNGVVIHEQVALNGPTRGAMDNNEVARGPLRFQGDHGAVAFRNIVITDYSQLAPVVKDVKYTIFRDQNQDSKKSGITTLNVLGAGSIKQLSSNLNGLPDNNFSVRYLATFQVREAGEFTFNLHAPSGGGRLTIDGKTVISDGRGDGKVSLPVGEFPLELVYVKQSDWDKPSLTLTVRAKGLRPVLLTDPNVPIDDQTDPILLPANEPTVLRSFMDLPDGAPKVVHAVSVGSPEKIHYTYDLDNGMLVQVWRGEFLNTTSMWDGRGNGTAVPLGTIQGLGKPSLAIAQLSGKEASWIKDTTGTSYKPEGYTLDESRQPVFLYSIYGTTVSDNIRVLPQSQGVYRKISVEQPTENLYVRIAIADKIEQQADGMYVIGDKAYYIKMESTGGIIREQDGHKELIVPVKGGAVSYALLF
jgi:hypothetical protein